MTSYRLPVAFKDGLTCPVQLEGELFDLVFKPLRDERFLGQARLDEFGAPCWPNEADLAPDAILDRLIGR